MRSKNVEIEFSMDFTKLHVNDVDQIVILPDNTMRVLRKGTYLNYHLDTDDGFDRFIKLIQKLERAKVRHELKKIFS